MIDVMKYLNDEQFSSRNDWKKYRPTKDGDIKLSKGFEIVVKELPKIEFVLFSNIQTPQIAVPIPSKFKDLDITQGYKYKHSFTGKVAKELREHFNI